MKKSIILALIIFVFTTNNLFSQTWIQTLNGIAMWSMCKDIQGNVYAGTSGTVKAVYKTTNAGQNWSTLITSGVTNFLSLSVDSLGNIYAANVSNGLMKSTDGGNNWTNIPTSTFGGKSVESVACGKNGYIYVGCISGGIFRSTDYGVTFPDTALTGATIVTLISDRYNSNIVYAGASSTSGTTGFFISTNSGINFTGPFNTNNCWGIMQSSQLTLYMITTSTGTPFSKSTDGGYNWTTVCTQPGAMRGCTTFRMNYLAICGNGGVFISSNYGASFTPTTMTYTGNQIVDLSNKLFAAISGTANGGVWIYTDLTDITPIGNEVATKYELEQNFPNPFNSSTLIRFSIPRNEFVELTVFDILGKNSESLINSELKSGKYAFLFDAKNLSSGFYVCKLKAGATVFNKIMVLIK